MSRLISKIFVAIFVFCVFLTLIPLRGSLPSRSDSAASHAVTEVPALKDESLRGASGQKPAAVTVPSVRLGTDPSAEQQQQQPVTSEPSEEEKKKTEEEQKAAEQEKAEAEQRAQEEEKKKNEDAENKKKEDARKKKEAEEAAAVAEYKKHKINLGSFEVPKDMVHTPEGPQPHEIVLLAASDGKGHNGGIENILGHVTPNRQEYADYHGYKYQFLNISKYDIGEAKPVWAKLPAIVETFNLYPDAKWVWWLDLDAIIMTPTVDLREHLLSHEALRKKALTDMKLNKPGGGFSTMSTVKNPDMNNIDMIIAQDHNGVNAGSFMLRRSDFTRLFLDMWSDPIYVKQDYLNQEQDALHHMLKEHPTIMEHVAFVRQTEINAYAVKDIKDMSWEPGNLVVHLAGCWINRECNDRWKEMWAARATLPAKQQ